MDPADSGSTSEVDDQPRTWGSDARELAPSADDAGSILHPQSDCGIGHRVLASRSVLALVIDEECVFAGLQGGDIVVSRLQWAMFEYLELCSREKIYPKCLDGLTPPRHGLSRPTISFYQYMHTRRVCWASICLRTATCCSPVVVIL